MGMQLTNGKSYVIIIIEREVIKMTLEEKFANRIIVEKIDDDYVCELWGASTKHPDASFRYSEWEDKSPYLEDEYQVLIRW